MSPRAANPSPSRVSLARPDRPGVALGRREMISHLSRARERLLPSSYDRAAASSVSAGGSAVFFPRDRDSFPKRRPGRIFGDNNYCPGP